MIGRLNKEPSPCSMKGTRARLLLSTYLGTYLCELILCNILNFLLTTGFPQEVVSKLMMEECKSRSAFHYACID